MCFSPSANLASPSFGIGPPSLSRHCVVHTGLLRLARSRKGQALRNLSDFCGAPASRKISVGVTSARALVGHPVRARVVAEE
jgi:hypothetical protein